MPSLHRLPRLALEELLGAAPFPVLHLRFANYSLSIDETQGRKKSISFISQIFLNSSTSVVPFMRQKLAQLQALFLRSLFFNI
jgi:hypothetical protein